MSLIGAAFFMALGLFILIFYFLLYTVAYGMNTKLAFYLTDCHPERSSVLRQSDHREHREQTWPAELAVLRWRQQWNSFSLPIKKDLKYSIVIFAALYGFTSGAVVPLATACLVQFPKDLEDIGFSMGMRMLIVSSGALIAPPINGTLVARYVRFKKSRY